MLCMHVVFLGNVMVVTSQRDGHASHQAAVKPRTIKQFDDVDPVKTTMLAAHYTDKFQDDLVGTRYHPRTDLESTMCGKSGRLDVCGTDMCRSHACSITGQGRCPASFRCFLQVRKDLHGQHKDRAAVLREIRKGVETHAFKSDNALFKEFSRAGCSQSAAGFLGIAATRSVLSGDAGMSENIYDKESMIWYIHDFLPEDEFHKVQSGCEKLRKKLKEDYSTAVGRLGAMVPPSNGAFKVFSAATLVSRLAELTAQPELRIGDYPVEVRLYKPGAFMDWHQDVSLYAEPQYELIYTVTNDSNALTEWFDIRGVLTSVRPPPNSLILLRADGASHRVVPATEGERLIIKALYTTSFAKTEAYANAMTTAPWRR
eukprot:gnl/TRDRNA2_/TRDRNA2_47293_c0_seq1.p1 gnl/TRDRNA2_/TRDRNA2_47293_c0~~gnl/TRDRNA2_/TRDRNA2_47293_c0_seq1.p1  ORF type:complete len:372 (-),score=42.35 gnl/TRDRNA2_/TRDRNA2_47293_c0_seq1:64-1179(-)